ncbi:LOW QUALITY PROTEIN: protein crumbs homolog 1-like [Argopecten irradians]|uniref:LOW QUALITY PROTEIN: protein crumbs homolog 1-like n=1 Tax=Argopecten irradians TaxID=31199 RepID=UPI00371C84EA
MDGRRLGRPRTSPLFHWGSCTVLGFFLFLLDVPTEATTNGRVAFFNVSMNSSLQIRGTNFTWNQIGAQLAFSYRTCSGGQLLYQRGSTGDFLSLDLNSNGTLEFRWKTGNEEHFIYYGNSLIGKDFYYVKIQRTVLNVLALEVVLYGNVVLNVSIANTTYRESIWHADLGGSAGIQVGRHLTGCVMEGPGISFRNNSNVEPINVLWGDTCPVTSCFTAGEDGNQCASVPCKNGGTCVDGFQSYSCQCPHLYNGTDCENNLSIYGCAVSPCLNGGSCQNVTASASTNFHNYTCTCAPGFTDVNCEVNINECELNSCQNGGQCVDGDNSFSCVCTSSFEGNLCEHDINECSRFAGICGPGTCFNFIGGYDCQCPVGYDSSRNCSQSLDDCLTGPCRNGGSCVDGDNSYTCQCIPGYTGTDCETNIDDCVGVSCSGPNKVCRDLVNTHECICKPGYYGDPCMDVNECLMQPCKNDANCTNLENDFSCSCLPGYTNKSCDVNINDCDPNPCQNGASCEDGVNTFTCTCVPGYTDLTCSTDIDECQTSGQPCRNGATCRNEVNRYECDCVLGWTGTHCETNIDECAPQPCQNYGTCHDYLNFYNCTCVTGFSGENCSVNIDDCSPDPCQNGGTCVDEVNGYRCDCPPTWMGKTCAVVYNACSFTPCKNGATCNTMPPNQQYNCACVPGYTGTDCETDIDECASNTCQSPQVCFDHINNYTCACPLGYTGENCSEEIDECDPNPCQNGATCVDKIGHYVCECPQVFLNLTRFGNGQKLEFDTGYNGTNCEFSINECDYNPGVCLSDGTCEEEDGLPGYHCKCGRDDEGAYRTGQNCDLRTSYCETADEVKRDPPACKYGGTCIPGATSFTCNCAPGYTNRRCEDEINECESSPCQYGGTCNDMIAAYNCTCIPGITGVNCEIDIDECESSPCLNNGRCNHSINMYECDCFDTGFNGTNCELNIDDCASNPCIHGSTCEDGIKDYNCSCYPGYTGKNCEIDINECLNSPCFYNGTCLQRSNQTLYEPAYSLPGYANFSYATAAGYSCVCIPGITGENCSVNIDDCVADNCTNGATCIDGINEYSCRCAPGYKDMYCQTEINECLEFRPCMNGASCTDLVANYDCICADLYLGKKYGGKNCTVELTACAANACQNGATCDPFLVDEATGVQDYRCECPSGYTGQFCEMITSGTFSEDSRYKVVLTSNTTNDIAFQFATTLPNGMLFIWDGTYPSTKTFVTIELVDGKLNMSYIHGSVITSVSRNTVEFPFMLNNAAWHSVFLHQHANNLTLRLVSSVCPSELDCTKEVNHAPNIAIQDIYFGRAKNEFTNDRTLSKTPFIGCLQDVTINRAIQIISEGGESLQVSRGCVRTDQCRPDPCNGNGACTDLWTNFRCDCHRPHLGRTCNQEYVAATFSFENTESKASFQIPDHLKSTLTSDIDLSLFMRTRQTNGFVVFFGFYGNTVSSRTFLTLEMYGGALVSRFVLCDFQKVLFANNTLYNSGFQHFVSMKFLNGEYTISVNNTALDSVIINSQNCPFNADKLYFGGEIPALSSSVVTESARARRSLDPAVNEIINDITNFNNITSYKGTLQDAQLNENSLQFIPPSDPSIVEINSILVEDNSTLTSGEQSDNICNLTMPCQHNSTCTNVFFNDFSCKCQRGFRGKDCGELDFCHQDSCPSGATCQSLTNGFECLSSTLFNPTSSSITYRPVLRPNKVIDQLSLRIKTLVRNGALLNIGYGNYYVKLSIVGGKVSVACKFGDTGEETLVAGYHVSNKHWYLVTFKDMLDNVTLTVQSDTGEITHASVSLVPQHKVHSFSDLVTTSNAQHVKFGQAIGSGISQFYRGCVKDIRLGGILLPFFEQSSFTNFTTEEYFEVVSMTSIPIGCVEGNQCLYQRCQNGAQCLAGYHDYQCTCPSGFEGRWCETNTPDCTPQSCDATHAVCVDLVDNYFCDCHPGYTGTRCDVSINYCQNNSCQNNGSCENGTNDYQCNCTEDFTGKDCSTQKYQGCNGSSLCQNNASCNTINLTDSMGQAQIGFNCSCLTGYEGDLCEIEIDFCAQPVCQNNGTCTSDTAAGRYTCTCLPGYSGDDCETDIQDCHGQCGNGGTCIDLVNDYACNCTDSWTGIHCEVDVNECNLTQPCQNGASCTNTDGGFTCNCYGTGYQGTYCSEDVDECQVGLDPCQHNSNCSNSVGDYSCACSYGYTDKNCSTPDCNLVTCENSGTCVATNVWRCSCLRYYYGERCEKRGPCLDNTCNKDNIIDCLQDVTVSPTDYTCHCKSGWNGTFCNTDINECELQPCQNGATCNNWDGTYNCTCQEGYDGSNCETDIDECASNPCQNGGTCSDRVNGFQCTCTEGYTNVTCMEDVNECISDPCINGGKCTNQPGTFLCECTSEYMGKLCAQRNPEYQKISRDDNLAIIIGPSVAAFLLLIVIGVIIFLVLARSKRATRGHYSPSRQEVTGSRVELGNVMKPPPEERLI